MRTCATGIFNVCAIDGYPADAILLALGSTVAHASRARRPCHENRKRLHAVSEPERYNPRYSLRTTRYCYLLCKTAQRGTSPIDPQTFITRWTASGGAERSNYQLFLSELCDLLGVPRPEPAAEHDHDNAYIFERAVKFHNGDGTTSTKFIDLYKRGAFVLETKQGVEHEESHEYQALSDAEKERRRNL